MRPIIRLFCGWGFLLIGAGFAPAQETVYTKALKSSVWIVQPVAMNRLRTGSGSLIDASQRLILTNYHVVGDDDKAYVLFPLLDKKGKLIPERDKYVELINANQAIEGKVVGRFPSKDLAILQLAALPSGAPALRLAKDSPGPSERVHSIGSPGVSGALFNYADGSVKSVYQKSWRALRMPNDPDPLQLSAKVIETSSSTNRGDSGGPLLNDKCELVGVTQGALVGDAETRPISYFIDVTEVRAALDSLVKAKKIKPVRTPAGATVAKVNPQPPITTANTQPLSESAKKEELATTKLELAKDLEKSGKVDKAVERYRDIVKQFPETKAAAEAKRLLEKHEKS